MMSMADLNIRVDDDVKNQLEFWLDKFGMNTTTAFNLFAKAVIRERRIPFEIQGDEYDNYVFDSLKEFETNYETNPTLLDGNDVFTEASQLILEANHAT